MKKGILLKCMLVLLCLPAAAVYATKNTPIETFINQVRETNKFVPVTLWQADNAFDKTELLKNVEDAMPLTIDYNDVASFIKQNNTAISLSIPGTHGITYTIDLAQYNFLSNKFEVHAMGANNSDRLVSYTPGLYYSGVVSGVPGSVAAFSFFNNEIYGIFSIPGEGNFTVVPNTMVGEYYNSNTHYILYNDADIKVIGERPGCGTDKLPKNYLQSAQKTTTTLNNNVYNSCSFVNVYEVADNALYIKKGSSVTNSTNYLTAVFNNQSTLYRNEGVPILLGYVQVNTATDVYQGITAGQSNYFLTKFGYTTQNAMHGCEVAILFSTRFNGNMGGVAWLQAACSGYYAPDSAGPYCFCNVNNSASTTSTAFPTYSWDVEVTTHEMGHSVGSPHTHACCWNPPARNTAIDGCYTLEGSCAMPSPKYPTAKGTIMSYCHLVSGVGINFSNGFGQQPGDTIRYYLNYIFSQGCGMVYNPTVALATTNRTITANRECTSMGSTYYWKDNNTAATNDDTLVLIINKNGNNIGNLNTSGFSVSTTTVTNYGTGAGTTILFPTGLGAGTTAPNYSMNRYWKVITPTNPTTNVEVLFPFLPVDSSDIDGSVTSGHPSPTSYRMYKTHSPINPDPKLDSFRYTTASNMSIYTYGGTASATKWSLSIFDNTYYAHMLMTKLSGGGAGYYNSAPTAVDNFTTENGNVSIYPNPTNDQWFVSVEKTSSTQPLIFQLYTADGKMIYTQNLANGAVNAIPAANLAAGTYFYHISSNENTYTGALLKK